MVATFKMNRLRQTNFYTIKTFYANLGSIQAWKIQICHKNPKFAHGTF